VRGDTVESTPDLSWQLTRLQELRKEYADGEARVAALSDERSRVRDRLLVLEGGMRILEEQLAGALEPVAESDLAHQA
jgi:hypothetical protein